MRRTTKKASEGTGKKLGGREALPEGRARGKVVSTRFSIPEYMRLKLRAKWAGKPYTVYIREAALEGKVVPRRTPEDRRQIGMLERCCNNLNQLVRIAHTDGVPQVGKQTLAVLREMMETLEKIRK